VPEDVKGKRLAPETKHTEKRGLWRGGRDNRRETTMGGSDFISGRYNRRLIENSVRASPSGVRVRSFLTPEKKKKKIITRESREERGCY